MFMQKSRHVEYGIYVRVFRKKPNPASIFSRNIKFWQLVPIDAITAPSQKLFISRIFDQLPWSERDLAAQLSYYFSSMSKPKFIHYLWHVFLVWVVRVPTFASGFKTFQYVAVFIDAVCY